VERGPGEGFAPRPLGAWEGRWIEAIDAFAARYPADADGASMLYAAGYRLYENNHFDRAAGYFRRVIEQDPRGPDARRAADLTLDGLAILEDWGRLAEAGAAFLATEGLGDAASRAEVAGVVEGARLKQIDGDLAAGGDRGAAGRAYVAFADAWPESERAEIALYTPLEVEAASFEVLDAITLRVLAAEGAVDREDEDALLWDSSHLLVPAR